MEEEAWLEQFKIESRLFNTLKAIQKQTTNKCLLTDTRDC